jgi:hypothetical protein
MSSCNSCSSTICSSNVSISNTSSAASANPDKEKLSQLKKKIQQAKINWSKPLTQEDEDNWNLLFSEIGLELAQYNASALKPLLSLFDFYGPKKFLSLCLLLIKYNLRGHLLCWAWQYVAQDCAQFLLLLQQQDSEFFQFCNKQAQFHECFPGNTAVGRVKSYNPIHQHDTDSESDSDSANSAEFAQKMANSPQTSSISKNSAPFPLFADEEEFDEETHADYSQSGNYSNLDYVDSDENGEISAENSQLRSYHYSGEDFPNNNDCGANCACSGQNSANSTIFQANRCCSAEHPKSNEIPSNSAKLSPDFTENCIPPLSLASELLEPAAELRKLMEEDTILWRAKRWVVVSAVFTTISALLAYKYNFIW